MALREFEIDETAVEEWLAWGGITRPNVLRQKGGSCFSVIEYKTYEKNFLSKMIEFPKFKRGWAMWLETQHNAKVFKNFHCQVRQIFFAKFEGNFFCIVEIVFEKIFLR